MREIYDHMHEICDHMREICDHMRKAARRSTMESCNRRRGRDHRKTCVSTGSIKRPARTLGVTGRLIEVMQTEKTWQTSSEQREHTLKHSKDSGLKAKAIIRP
jgi:hypothetical protein